MTEQLDAQVRKLLRIEEAAARLGYAPGTLRAMRQTHTGPPSFIHGGRITYDADELDAWLKAKRTATHRGGDR